MDQRVPGWTVVIPVKGTDSAKSRLGGDAGSRAELARAIALDTVEAVLASGSVSGVIVVTTSAAGEPFAQLGARVVVDDSGAGLNPAIALGVAAAGDPGAAVPVGIAVLLGDVPALRPEELDAALVLAQRHPTALVPDADGVGSVLTTAMVGYAHSPAFGGGSRAAHLLRGYVELDLPADSGLRRDVDTLVQLRELGAARVGTRTAALL